MRTEEFWVLDEDDREVVARLTPGLGEDAARVLAYLLLRSAVEEGPATELALRIGTGLNRNAIASAVDRLESAGVVDRTAVRDDGPGRPPTAWRARSTLDASPTEVYRHHAGALLDRAAERFGTEEGAPDDRDEQDERLTLGLNWRPNGLHLPFYAGHEGYDEFGVEVDVEHREGSHRALDALVSGESDVGLVGAATVLRARAAGEAVVPIAVVYQRAMAVLYTVRERFGEPLTGVDQLRDRRVGMPARSETRVLGRLFLSQVAPDGGVRIVDTAGEEQDALLSGEVDVVTGSFSDPRRLERRGMTVDTLAVADRFPIYGPTLVVREGTLSARRSALEGFLAGTTAGWAEARLDPTPAAERVAARSSGSVDRAVRTFEVASREFGGSDAVREHGWGWQREETWERLRAALDQGSLLSGPGSA
ncbi:ABC transporter substrate-binding protein [Halalkalicoccus sp. NIPERK01]|uniref:ABC transporter substrate-binding protein n=1 Tax=Halalkalicoccus sp. NIPERK01 TaxID=3053469 RepID=UPI00256EA4EA|nr:ABC transporter substrate-binding protein [Halalkalicoccus sp. NIPERK01]MDL5362481.1 ABC transporter substrate-binding protein [Halalkalicoccus sp. NIPERK01]